MGPAHSAAATPVLRGRRDERAVLDGLLDDARAGRSGVLLLRGEAGGGKTALLEYAVEYASDLRALRAAGVESERELAFVAALNSATSSNAIDPNAEDNCDDAETGNAQESNGYEELPELQAVVIDRALHDELTAGPTRPTERLLKGQRAPATCPLPKPRCSPRSVTNGIRRRRRGGHATRCLWRSHISHSQDRYRRFTGRDNCRGRSYVLLAHGLRVSSPRSD